MDLRDLFFNQAGRLRSGWRLLIFAAALYFTIALCFAAVKFALYLMLGPSAGTVLDGNWGFLLQALALLIPAILVGWACGRLLEGLPFKALGWGRHRGWFSDWLYGSAVGAASLLLAAAIATLAGGFRFALNGPLLFQSVGRTLLVSALIFVLAAAAEEAMFRGYPLQTMTRAGLAWVAILITSLIFSWGHLGNPNVVPGFTFANTAIAGLWLAVAYLRTRSLWFALGIHWAWNWTMGAVLGLPVSGIERLTPDPLLRGSDLGPAWLTGGAYGLEGGAACTVALLVSTLFIWRTRLVAPTAEMKQLTDAENPQPQRQPPSIFEQQQGEDFPA
ncbi:MAG TPA: type II CAAX endopeptidase family protein [Pyrinomonadaceae bacterium]|jgi:hypothetical protein